jgi:hypothetical protein
MFPRSELAASHKNGVCSGFPADRFQKAFIHVFFGTSEHSTGRFLVVALTYHERSPSLFITVVKRKETD